MILTFDCTAFINLATRYGEGVGVSVATVPGSEVGAASVSSAAPSSVGTGVTRLTRMINVCPA
jgi:hypothetical protein